MLSGVFFKLEYEKIVLFVLFIGGMFVADRHMANNRPKGKAENENKIKKACLSARFFFVFCYLSTLS